MEGRTMARVIGEMKKALPHVSEMEREEACKAASSLLKGRYGEKEITVVASWIALARPKDLAGSPAGVLRTATEGLVDAYTSQGFKSGYPVVVAAVKALDQLQKAIGSGHIRDVVGELARLQARKESMSAGKQVEFRNDVTTSLLRYFASGTTFEPKRSLKDPVFSNQSYRALNANRLHDRTVANVASGVDMADTALVGASLLMGHSAKLGDLAERAGTEATREFALEVARVAKEITDIAKVRLAAGSMVAGIAARIEEAAAAAISDGTPDAYRQMAAKVAPLLREARFTALDEAKIDFETVCTKMEATAGDLDEMRSTKKADEVEASDDDDGVDSEAAENGAKAAQLAEIFTAKASFKMALSPDGSVKTRKQMLKEVSERCRGIAAEAKEFKEAVREDWAAAGLAVAPMNYDRKLASIKGDFDMVNALAPFERIVPLVEMLSSLDTMIDGIERFRSEKGAGLAVEDGESIERIAGEISDAGGVKDAIGQAIEKSLDDTFRGTDAEGLFRGLKDKFVKGSEAWLALETLLSPLPPFQGSADKPHERLAAAAIEKGMTGHIPMILTCYNSVEGIKGRRTDMEDGIATLLEDHKKSLYPPRSAKTRSGETLPVSDGTILAKAQEIVGRRNTVRAMETVKAAAQSKTPTPTQTQTQKREMSV